MKMLFTALLLPLLAISGVSGASCESPKYSSTSYSTLDGFFHFTTTYIVDFALQCSNNIKDHQFYAVVNGKAHHVASSEETSRYQVSWMLEHSESGSQTFDVQIFDEDRFNAYKNAENKEAVQPLLTLQHYHAGVSKKSPIASETVVALIAAVGVYYATKFRSQLKA